MPSATIGTIPQTPCVCQVKNTQGWILTNSDFHRFLGFETVYASSKFLLPDAISVTRCYFCYQMLFLLPDAISVTRCYFCYQMLFLDTLQCFLGPPTLGICVLTIQEYGHTSCLVFTPQRLSKNDSILNAVFHLTTRVWITANHTFVFHVKRASR